MKIDRGTLGFLSGAINNLEFCTDKYSTLSKEVKSELKEMIKRLEEIKNQAE
ncbi:hypothetical protein ACLQ7P_23030 (plasmid) [Bacillus subtilis subsp. subtilis]